MIYPIESGYLRIKGTVGTTWMLAKLIVPPIFVIDFLWRGGGAF